MMQISEINIVPVKPQDGKVAHASCVIDDSVYLGSLGIYTRPEGGYRITYPTKKLNDRSFNVYHPISKEAGALLEGALVNKYLEITKGENYG